MKPDKKNAVKNILYVHANNKDIGGADYCLFKLAAQLDKEKFNPVVCLSMKTDILKLYKKAGIKVYIIKMERIKKSKSPFYLAKLLMKFIPAVFEIRKIIKKENIHLVHGNDLLDIYGPVAGQFAGIPTVQHCRMILTSSVLKKALSGIVRIINNTVISISEGVASEMFSNKQKQIHPKIAICHDWFDFESIGHGRKNINIRAEYHIPEDAPLIGVVGRLEPWKGQDLFLKAASTIIKSYPDARFMVVGGSVAGRGRERYIDELTEIIRKSGIENNVIFTGHRSDIHDIMMSLDIFVLSSATPEPLGQVVMEAGGCAKPVVASNAGGPPEIIVNGTTGILYPIGDYTKIAGAVIQILSDPQAARQMGIKAKKRIDQFFNKQFLCNKIEHVYTKILTNESQTCKGGTCHVSHV